MRTMDRKRLIGGLVLLLTLAGPASPQEPPKVPGPTPTFPARVEQVTVDVVVVDGKGRPVTDLTRESFEIYEDGVRQAIASFDLFQVAAAAPAAIAEAPATAPVPQAPSRVSTNATPQDERGRTFVIVFDDVHLTARTAQQAKAAVAVFLKSETREGDRVTLVAASGVCLVDRAHGGRPRGPPRAAEEGPGAPRSGDEARLDLRLRSHAHQRLQGQHDPQPGPAALRDLQRPDRDGAEPARAGHDGGRGPGHHGAGERGLLRGNRAQPPDAGGAGAGDERPRPREGPQVGRPRVRRLHLRPPAPRVQAARRRGTARQRRVLLREQPRPRGAARRARRRVQHRPSRGRPGLSPSSRTPRRPRARRPWPRTAAGSRCATRTTSRRA